MALRFLARIRSASRRSAPAAARRRAWAVRTSPLLLVLVLSGCLSSSAPSGPVAFRLLGARIAISPASYAGACGQRQSFSYTATLTAVGGHGGGTAHYRWRVGYDTAEGDVTFAAGQVEQSLTRTLALDDVQPDLEPLVRASIATTAPNAVASPELAVPLPCTTPLHVLSVDLQVSPTSAGCGPSTFGFSAILAAPEGNVGGDVRYTWHFLNGAATAGAVKFAPGQINAALSAGVTYFVARGRSGQAGQAARIPAAALASPIPPQTPTPRPTRTPTRTPTATPAPLGTPALPGKIGAWLTVEAPNSLRSDTVAPSIAC